MAISTMFAVAMVFSLSLTGVAFAATDQEALAKIEYDFAAMQITKDPATMERVAAIMDDGFRFTDPARRDLGATKAEMLMTIRSEKLVITSTDFRPFSIRISGATAILEGVNISTGSFGGRDISGAFAWLDVFEKRDGRWVWLFSQSGLVGDKVSDKETCSRPSCPTSHPGFSIKR